MPQEYRARLNASHCHTTPCSWWDLKTSVKWLHGINDPTMIRTIIDLASLQNHPKNNLKSEQGRISVTFRRIGRKTRWRKKQDWWLMTQRRDKECFMLPATKTRNQTLIGKLVMEMGLLFCISTGKSRTGNYSWIINTKFSKYRLIP